jgi:hypothetical protein
VVLRFKPLPGGIHPFGVLPTFFAAVAIAANSLVPNV